MEGLFQPFQQTEAGDRSGEGTGLGLALSRDMARLMGGDVTARGAPGGGTCFVVDVDLPESPDGVEAATARRVVALAPDQPAWRVLVVDDVAENRLALSGLLRAVGFEVSEAADAGEALDAWRRVEPHLVWMDTRMPGTNGLEVTRRIREEETRRGRRTSILALSASALEHEREEILAAGCDDFASKPYREDTVFDLMTRHLGARFVRTGSPADAPSSGVGEGRRRPGVASAEGRVLLVDDDWICREVAGTILRDAGLDVAVASGGEEALRLLRQGPVDLLLTDLQMPGMDGRELARRARADAERELRLVAMTAELGAEDGNGRLAGSGFDAWVTKPVKPDALLGTVLRLLRGEARSE